LRMISAIAPNRIGRIWRPTGETAGVFRGKPEPRLRPGANNVAGRGRGADGPDRNARIARRRREIRATHQRVADASVDAAGQETGCETMPQRRRARRSSPSRRLGAKQTFVVTAAKTTATAAKSSALTRGRSKPFDFRARLNILSFDRSKKRGEMHSAAVGGTRYVFPDLKTLMAKATPRRSGDELTGVAHNLRQRTGI